MKVLNLIWGFATGGGIDKCFITYGKIGDVFKDIEMRNVCISLEGQTMHPERLSDIGTCIISIKSRKDFSWVRRLKSLINVEQPDVLFSHGFNGAIVLWIERLCGIKQEIVLSYHGLYTPPTASHRLFTGLYNGLSFWIYRHVARNVICVSEDSRRQVINKKVPEIKTITVLNGIKEEVTNKKVEMSHDVINIVSCSRIDAIKGLDFLLKAMALLKKEGYKFHYYMIGDGPELDKLKIKCVEMGLEEYISFTGYQDNIPEWLNGADVFVIPSLQENHSIAVLEAMRAGKAIVATDVGGNSESIRNEREGLLVNAGEVEPIYEALKRLIIDEKLRSRLSIAAKMRFKEHFTEEVMYKKLYRILKG